MAASLANPYAKTLKFLHSIKPINDVDWQEGEEDLSRVLGEYCYDECNIERSLGRIEADVWQLNDNDLSTAVKAARAKLTYERFCYANSLWLVRSGYGSGNVGFCRISYRFARSLLAFLEAEVNHRIFTANERVRTLRKLKVPARGAGGGK